MYDKELRKDVLKEAFKDDAGTLAFLGFVSNKYDETPFNTCVGRKYSMLSATFAIADWKE